MFTGCLQVGTTRDDTFVLEEAEVEREQDESSQTGRPDYVRADLQENIDRHAYTLDENRPEAVAKSEHVVVACPRKILLTW